MMAIVQGKLYDESRSTLVAAEEGESLYITDKGEWFVVGNEPAEIRPLTRDQAEQWLLDPQYYTDVFDYEIVVKTLGEEVLA